MTKPGSGLVAGACMLGVFAFLMWSLFAGGDDYSPDVVTPGEAPAPLAAPDDGSVAVGRTAVVAEEADKAVAVTQRYILSSARTGEPLPGATVRLAATGELLATTDESGAATVRGHAIGHLVFCADGHLLAYLGMDTNRLALMKADAARHGHYKIRLEADRYTIPFAFRFMSSAGARPNSVWFRLRCTSEDLVRGTEPKIHPRHVNTWRVHGLISQLAGFEALTNHFGVESSERAFTSSADVTVRFTMPGRYLIDVLSSEGEVARQAVQVTIGQSSPFVMFLERARAVAGEVVSADGGPVKGAIVTLRQSVLGNRNASTDADGRFELHSVPDEPLALHVQHGDFEDHDVPARHPRGEPWRIVLRPRPSWVVRGIVRSRPGRRPVANATVSLTRAGGPEAKVVTGPNGRFSCRSTMDDVEIAISADGFMDYGEIVTRPSAPSTYDLIPASSAERVSRRMTAMIAGQVLLPNGEVRPSTAVRLVPEGLAPFGGAAGRRILRGGVLSLPHIGVADGAGRFEIECMLGGRARLVPLDGMSKTEDGLWVDVMLGTVTSDLTLHALR